MLLNGDSLKKEEVYVFSYRKLDFSNIFKCVMPILTCDVTVCALWWWWNIFENKIF